MKNIKKIFIVAVIGSIVGVLVYKIAKLFKEEGNALEDEDEYEEREYIELENSGQFKDL